jgi:hypothetical protein
MSLREDHAIVNALARAQDPEELARLVNRRGLNTAKLSEVLPAPAVKLVERVVHLETVVRQQARRVELAARAEGRRGMSRPRDFVGEAQVGTVARQNVPGSGTHASGGAGGARVTQLANKLLNLIHLAEVDQRARDAPAQVRMSDSVLRDATGGPAGDSDVKAPNLNALKRDVFEAVVGRLQELDDRSVEDPDGHAMWW